LWFDDKADEAMNFYVSIFKNSKLVSVTRYGDAGPGPKGTVMTATFQLVCHILRDDGDTGYFYAMERKDGEFHIVEALQIYVVTNVTDRQKPSELAIVWCSDRKQRCSSTTIFTQPLISQQSAATAAQVSALRPPIGKTHLTTEAMRRWSFLLEHTNTSRHSPNSNRLC